MSQKQSIKRSRIRMYFLQAARDMIAQEGVESVSVRKIADISGYSYPTMYNYFSDLNAMLWETRQLMIWEMAETMRKRVDNPLNSLNDLKMAFKAYVRYFLEYPNIFRFFYMHSLQKPNVRLDGPPLEPDFGAMWNEAFSWFVLNGRMRREDVEIVAKTLVYAIHGMLTLRFSGNGDLCEEGNMDRDLNAMVDYLLARQECL